MAYLTARSLRGFGAEVATATGTAAATSTAPAQQVPAESDDFTTAVAQATAAATSWWDAMPEYKRSAIVTGATSALVFYWASRILGSVFGNR